LAGYAARARQLADEVLFPAAMAVDRSDAVPAGHFDRLAEAGLYALAGPAELGGLDTDPSAPSAAAAPSVAGPVLEALAGGCLATAFVWAQHHGLVRMLHREAGPELRDRWLGPACRGEVRGGLALAGLLPGPPGEESAMRRASSSWSRASSITPSTWYPRRASSPAGMPERHDAKLVQFSPAKRGGASSSGTPEA